jgi:hypothetical protein
MNFELSVVFSLTIGIAAIAGLLKLKKADPSYIPFLCLVFVSLANEVFSIIIVKAGYSNVFLYNFFSFVELLLITQQFFKWGLFETGRRPVYILITVLLIVWIMELVLRNGFLYFSSYYIVAYSLAIVIMSINMMNKVMFNEPAKLFYNSIFLICMGFVIYFTYAILVEVFWFYGLDKSRAFRISIYEILTYINLFTNLIYVLAIVWIPMKRRYILQS